MEQHKHNLQKTKDCLESCLKESDSPYKDQITLEEQTPFAVKFKFRLDLSQEFDVDLLLTFKTADEKSSLVSSLKYLGIYIDNHILS